MGWGKRSSRGPDATRARTRHMPPPIVGFFVPSTAAGLDTGPATAAPSPTADFAHPPLSLSSPEQLRDCGHGLPPATAGSSTNSTLALSSHVTTRPAALELNLQASLTSAAEAAGFFVPSTAAGLETGPTTAAPSPTTAPAHPPLSPASPAHSRDCGRGLPPAMADSSAGSALATGSRTATRPAAMELHLQAPLTSAAITATDTAAALQQLKGLIAALTTKSDIQTLLQGIRDTFTAELSAVCSDVSSLAARVSALESVDAVPAAATADASTPLLSELRRKMDDLDNRGRRCNIRIRGLRELDGLHLTWHQLNHLVLLYGNSEQKIYFMDYLVCMVRLKGVADSFRQYMIDEKGVYLSLEKMIQLMI